MDVVPWHRRVLLARVLARAVRKRHQTKQRRSSKYHSAAEIQHRPPASKTPKLRGALGTFGQLRPPRQEVSRYLVEKQLFQQMNSHTKLCCSQGQNRAGCNSSTDTFNFEAFGLSVFGVTLATARNWQDDSMPELDLLELWSGVGSVVAAGRAENLSATGYDTRDALDQDLTTEGGFKNALALVLSLRKDGLLIMAPDCSSFSFPNSSRCKRKFTNSFKGDENYPPVQSGNIMAEVACFFLALAMQRGLYVGLENSAGSTIFSYLDPWLRQLPKTKVYIIHRCSYDNSAIMGARMKKGYKFMVSGSDGGVWFAPAAQRCHCVPNTHAPLMETRGTQVSGTPNLRASQAYPAAMGVAIVQAWLKAARQL